MENSLTVAASSGCLLVDGMGPPPPLTTSCPYPFRKHSRLKATPSGENIAANLVRHDEIARKKNRSPSSVRCPLPYGRGSGFIDNGFRYLFVLIQRKIRQKRQDAMRTMASKIIRVRRPRDDFGIRSLSPNALAVSASGSPLKSTGWKP
jgi:hypothetical protein